MTLKRSIQSATGRIFRILNSIQVSITYVKVGTPAYDTSTGTATRSNTTHVLKVLKTQPDQKNTTPAPGTTQSTRGYILKRVGMTFTPDLEDYIIDNGETLEIKEIKEEPSLSIWVLRCEVK